MRLARIEMIFQREEEIALKVLKYSPGTMRRWGIDVRGRTEPPGPVPGSERGERCGATGGRKPRGALGPGSVPLPCTCHQGLVATESSQAQRARGHRGLEATRSLWPPRAHGHQGLVASEGALLPAASPSVSALKLKLLFALPRWPGLAAKRLLEREEGGWFVIPLYHGRCHFNPAQMPGGSLLPMHQPGDGRLAPRRALGRAARAKPSREQQQAQNNTQNTEHGARSSARGAQEQQQHPAHTPGSGTAPWPGPAALAGMG